MASPKITLFRMSGKSQTFAPVESQTSHQDSLYVLLRDVELPEKWRKNRPHDGRPQTVHFAVPDGSREMFPMNESMQKFFTALTPGFPLSKMAQICDAFFVVGGKFYQGGFDIYTGEGEPGKWAKYPGYLGFAGATVRCIGTENGLLKIEAVNPVKLPNPVDVVSWRNYVTEKPLKFALTTTQGDSTNPFPHNGGKDIFSVLFSDTGYLLIEPERCRPVSIPEAPYQKG